MTRLLLAFLWLLVAPAAFAQPLASGYGPGMTSGAMTSAYGAPVLFGGPFSAPVVSSPYSTWNAAINPTQYAYTNGNLTAGCTGCGSAAYGTGDSTSTHSTGKYYFETVVNFSGTPCCFSTGVVNAAGLPSTGNSGNVCGQVCFVPGSGQMQNAGATVVTFSVPATGTVVRWAIDETDAAIWIAMGCAGLWNNSGTATPATPATGVSITGFSGATLYLATVDGFSSGNTAVLNVGSGGFSCALPSGYTAWH